MHSSGNYQPQATTSQKMMKIFAFASSLVELLAVGLQTYNRACYRQFVKRIGHIIRSADRFIGYSVICYSNFPDIYSIQELMQSEVTLHFLSSLGLVRMTLCYVSDHWAQYVSLTGVSRTTMQEQSFSMEKLQVEFDHLFLRAVLRVLKAKRYDLLTHSNDLCLVLNKQTF